MRFFNVLWRGGLSPGLTSFGWEPLTIWKRRLEKGYETGISVEQKPFLCKTQKFGFVRGCERNANAIPILTIGMRSSFYLNTWSTKLSRSMSSGRRLIGWSCARETQIELVSALKDRTTSSLMAVLEGKSEVPEVIYVVDVEGASPDEPKAKGHAPAAASTSSPIFHSPVMPMICTWL